MKRTLIPTRAALAAMLALASTGCSTDAPSGPGRRAAGLATEATRPWGREVLRVHAVGVQTYRVERCSNGRVALKFVGPRADLFDGDGRKIGTHFMTDAGPPWDVTGGRVVGRKLRERSSPNVGSIPELQLAATVSGDGTIASATLIERVATSGGVAPALDASMREGDVVESPYEADYVFYSAAN